MSDGTDVADLLRGYAAQQERAATAQAPDVATELLALAGRVRRRRLVRTSAVVAVGAAAALVGSVAVWGVTRPDPVVPAPQPTQSTVAPLPTSDPTAPTPEPTGPGEPTAPAGVTVHALLPKVQPMRADLWAQTGDGWILGNYRAARDEADGSRVESPTVLYLVAPDGATYEVPVPVEAREVDGAPAEWRVIDWLPGESRAVLDLYRPAEDSGDQTPLNKVVVDLATGKALVTYDPMSNRVLLLPGDRTLVVRDAPGGGRVVQIHDRDGYHLSEIGPFQGVATGVDGWSWSDEVGIDPTRAQLAIHTSDGLSAFDLTTGRELAIPMPPAPATTPCIPYSWLEKDRLVLRCAEVGAAETLAAARAAGDPTAVLASDLWVVNFGDGSSRRLTEATDPSGAQVTSLWQVGGRVVAGRYSPDEDCGHGLALVARDGTQTPVGGVGQLLPEAVRGDRLIGETWACGTGSTSAIVQVDPGTGQVAPIAPRVDGVEASFEPPASRFTQFVDGGWAW